MSPVVHQIPAWVTQTNSWVMAHEPGGLALLVDAPPDPEAVGRHLAELGVSVVGILITHGHVDHTGGAGRLASMTGASTYVHPDDDFLTLHPIAQLERIFGMVPPGEYDMPDELIHLEDGEVLTLAGIDLEVRLTPGHTPGHCCFLWEDQGMLFSGDQLFAGSIGRTDLPGGSYEDLMRSMKSQVLTLDDDIRVLPGHGPETTIGRERRHNPFLQSMG